MREVRHTRIMSVELGLVSVGDDAVISSMLSRIYGAVTVKEEETK